MVCVSLAMFAVEMLTQNNLQFVRVPVRDPSDFPSTFQAAARSGFLGDGRLGHLLRAGRGYAKGLLRHARC